MGYAAQSAICRNRGLKEPDKLVVNAIPVKVVNVREECGLVLHSGEAFGSHGIRRNVCEVVRGEHEMELQRPSTTENDAVAPVILKAA